MGQVQVIATQLCLTLCNPMDCSLSGSSVHGILQARVLQWVTIPFSKGIFLTQELSLTLQADSLLSEPPGKPALGQGDQAIGLQTRGFELGPD